MKKLEEIDYTPLETMNHAFWITARKIASQTWGRLLLIIVLALAVLGIITLNIALVIMPAFACLIIVGTQVDKYKNSIWANFAAANGWEMDTSTPEEALVPPSMQFGSDRKHSPVIMAQLNDITADLFSYNCTTGSGKNATTHYFTVARVQLPKNLPHLVLLSKKAYADLQRDLANATTLELEGNFSDYFTLQVEQGQQIDALAVITPDVMQTLLTYNQKEDIEIIGADLFYILNADHRNSNDVRQLLSSVDALTIQIMQNLSIPPAQSSSVPA
jgi:hypothetical protein